MVERLKLASRNDWTGLYKVLGYSKDKSNSKGSKDIKVQTKSNKQQKEDKNRSNQYKRS